MELRRKTYFVLFCLHWPQRNGLLAWVYSSILNTALPLLALIKNWSDWLPQSHCISLDTHWTRKVDLTRGLFRSFSKIFYLFLFLFLCEFALNFYVSYFDLTIVRQGLDSWSLLKMWLNINTNRWGHIQKKASSSENDRKYVRISNPRLWQGYVLVKGSVQHWLMKKLSQCQLAGGKSEAR